MRLRHFSREPGKQGGMSSLTDDLMEYVPVDDRVRKIRETRETGGDAGPYWAWSIIDSERALSIEGA